MRNGSVTYVNGGAILLHQSFVIDCSIITLHTTKKNKLIFIHEFIHKLQLKISAVELNAASYYLFLMLLQSCPNFKVLTVSSLT